MRARALLLSTTALLLASCDENPFKPSDLKEVTWNLEAIERSGSPTTQISTPEQYTLKLGNDGRLSARADCNTCTTTYTLDGATLTVGALACTRVACPAGSLETTYSSVLSGTSAIAISDSHLILRNGTVTLRFRN
jgi:heat shock protein HslJ